MRKYPSQEDAQMLVDIMNDKGIYTGACSPEFKKLGEEFNTAPKGWKKLYDKAFGLKSPWAYDIDYKHNNKRTLIWDKRKAKTLGI